MNPKKKGNAWENKLANWLVANGIKAWKDGASGGGTNEKGDVGNTLNLHIESKSGKKFNIKQIWEKAELECQKTHNEPILFIHYDGMPDNEWLTVIHSETWLDLITKNQGVKTDYQDPKLKYAIQALVEGGKRVLKMLNH